MSVSSPTATVTANHLWAAVLVATLADQGVKRAVVSPGSRSTPLALAVDAHPGIEVLMHADERSAAFFALGLALGDGAPVALVCTSGTAAANYLPAVVEASLSRVPLVVLTADRPPALRGLGAAQTIDQLHLYGHAVRRFQELPLPAVAPAALRALAAHVALAAASAVTAPAGPVHLNVPFDEPLVPGPGEIAAARDAAAGWRHPRVYPATPRASEPALVAARALLAAARRPVLFAGAGLEAGGEALLGLAATLDAPVIADVGSGLRGADHPLVVAHGDAFLRQPQWREHQPDLVIRIGGAPTGRGVITYMASLVDVPQLTLQADLMGRDADVAADVVVVGDVADALGRLQSAACPAEPGWSARWQAAEAGVAAIVPTAPAESLATLAAASKLPVGGRLCLSNSLPVRHADAYWGVEAAAGRQAHSFRGANGIDGVTSMAIGIARASGQPTLLVTGDLAALHDLGGLVAAKQLQTPMVVMVINNDGGGIFSQLPIAEATASFEPLFGTPHGHGFAHAAALFGLPYAACRTPAEVGEAVEAGLARPGLTLVELTADRAATARDQKAFMARATELRP